MTTTVRDHLRAAGATADETREVADKLLDLLPLDGPRVALTSEVVDALRRHDYALVTALLAPEVEPDGDERAALRELDEHPELRETVPWETVKKDLGL